MLASLMAASRVLVAMAASSIEASPIDVTLIQYRALVVIATTSPINMTELGRQLGLSPSSTTRLVERLERKHLVARSAGVASRRTVELRLEPDGDALVATVMTERRRRLEELLAGVSARRQDTMRRAFEDLAQLAGEPVVVPASVLGRSPAAG